jgi:hypothetical protein
LGIGVLPVVHVVSVTRGVVPDIGSGVQESPVLLEVGLEGIGGVVGSYRPIPRTRGNSSSSVELLGSRANHGGLGSTRTNVVERSPKRGSRTIELRHL